MANRLTKRELAELSAKKQQGLPGVFLGVLWLSCAAIALSTWLFWLAFKGVQAVWGLF
jgi:hypothetical protein